MGKIIISENLSLDGVIKDLPVRGLPARRWFASWDRTRSVAKVELDERWAPRPCCWPAQLPVFRRAVAIPAGEWATG